MRNTMTCQCIVCPSVSLHSTRNVMVGQVCTTNHYCIPNSLLCLSSGSPCPPWSAIFIRCRAVAHQTLQRKPAQKKRRSAGGDVMLSSQSPSFPECPVPQSLTMTVTFCAGPADSYKHALFFCVKKDSLLGMGTLGKSEEGGGGAGGGRATTERKEEEANRMK